MAHTHKSYTATCRRQGVKRSVHHLTAASSDGADTDRSTSSAELSGASSYLASPVLKQVLLVCLSTVPLWV
jgi:hypothetical protein